MNYKKAKKILNINNDNFDFKLLKHNYYKLALINHPDKSNDLNSKEKFQDITSTEHFIADVVKFDKNTDLALIKLRHAPANINPIKIR